MNNVEINYGQFMMMLNSTILKECTIEITNSCPFKCDHCYVEKSEIKMMTLEQFKDIINQLLKIQCNVILITGGEPMANPAFLDMYIYAKKKGMIVHVNTTCFLMNEKILNTFIKYKPKSIEISLYGYDNITYEKFTHKEEAFDKVFENIKKLKNNNINISLKSVLTKKNYNYIDKLKELSQKNNIRFRYDYIVFPKVIDNKFKKNEEALDVNSIIKVIKQDNNDAEYFKNAVKNVKQFEGKENNINEVFQCTLGKDRAFIDCNLYIKPCLVVPIKYNLNDYSLKEAIKLMNEEAANIKFKSESKCKNCYKRKLCRYCPGRFFLETGSYEVAPKFYCEMADALIKEFDDEI